MQNVQALAGAFAPSLATPDFRAFFEALPDPCLVMDRNFRIVAATDSYLAVVMRTRESLVGLSLFEAFPDNPNDPSAAGSPVVRASLERVLAHRKPDRLEVVQYDIARPESEGGGFEERHWSPLHIPLFDAKGEVQYILHRVEDVTAIVHLKRDDDAQKAALRAITARNEERYAELLDAAPDAMVVVSSDGTIRLLNAQTEKIFGYKRAQLLGKPLSSLLPARFRDAHERHFHRFFQNPDARAMGSGLELLGMRSDGSEFPVEVSLSPLRTDQGLTVSAAVRDITERKRLERESKLLYERFVSAVNSIPDAFAIYDREQRLVLCNDSYRQGIPLEGDLLGRPYADFVGAAASQLTFPDEDARRRFIEERLRPLDADTRQFDARPTDGRRLRVTDRRTPEGGMVKLVTDMTAEARHAEELDAARRSAEAASLAKSEFLASMSHELRTPLNAIMGFAQLLQRDKRDPLSPKHRERAEHILRGGQHLLRLIDDVLDLAKIESGRVSMSMEPVDVGEVLAAVKASVEPMLPRLGVELHVSDVPEGFPAVAVDRTRFMQILVNLTSNAIKYNRAQGRVDIEVSAQGAGFARVLVRDTGHGIQHDKQDKLFQPFQRAGQETGPIEGTGIGLVISQRLARLMNGDVGFASHPGEGSSFWVDVPVHDRGVASKRELLEFNGSIAPSAFAEHRLVLYIEDNPANVRFMQDLLSGYDGIELVTASTAEEGVTAALRRTPQLILMDINLPGIDGFEALRTLRAHAQTERVPVIALTAAASDRERQRGIEAGFFRYLTKPVKVDELMLALEVVLVSQADD